METRPGKGPEQLTRPSWAKDNLTLAMSRVGDIHLYRYAPDKAQDKVTFWAVWASNDPQWSLTDDRLLVVGESGDGLYLLDDATKGAYQFDTKYEIWSKDASQGFRNLRPGAVTKIADVQSDARHPAWSPDGKEIAYVSQKAVWVVAPSGGTPKRLTSDGWPLTASRRLGEWPAGC